MNLCYTLPAAEAEALCPHLGDEKIEYCVPYDLTREGAIGADGWIVVTRQHLFRLEDGTLQETVALADCSEILCITAIDSGILAARKKEGEEDCFLCRFSMRHIVRQSYVARGATLFCRGEMRLLTSPERERYCPKCGAVLPGTDRCPHCDGGSRSMRRLWDLCSSYALPLILLTLFMAGTSVITLLQQAVQRQFIDEVLVPAEGTNGQIALFLLLMVGMLALSLTLGISKTALSNRLGTRISRDLRARVFEKINLLSLSFVDKRQTGELMNRVMDDTGQVRQFMEEVFAGMFTQLFTMAGAIVIMLVMNWKLALLTVAFLPLAALLVRVFHKQEMRLWRQQWRFNDKLNNRLQDVISGIRVVKSFGQEERETKRFKEYTARYRDLQQRNERFFATLYPFVSYLLSVGTFFVLYFGGRGVLNGTMTIGQVTQFVAYASMLFGPLGWLTRLPRMLMRLTTSLERIYDILDEEPSVAERPNAKPHEIKGDIRFENVTFGYQSYEPVLERVSFEVKPGEMIGLVGASGTGKSTLINLIMRLYDVDDGRILVDGIDMRDLDKASLHSQIGVVLQETFLFTGTIYDNIRYAKPDATQEEVIRAAKMANAHEFIVRFPDGYDTYVGEHGYTLSGGERQRIAIARAILHHPHLLILDEATSALDTETEFQIQEALDRLTAGRTTFAIAHRLSTLRNADRILVLDRHGVAEIGTHDELIRRRGLYYNLVVAQLEMHKVREA